MTRALYASSAILFLLAISSCGSSSSKPDGGMDAGGRGGTTGIGGQAGTSLGGRGGGGGTAGTGGGSAGRGGAGGTGGSGDAGGRGGAGGNRSCGSNSDCQGGQVCYVGINSCGTPAGGQCVTRLSDGCSGCACLGIVGGSCPAGQGANCLESGVAGGCWYCAAPF